MKIQKQMAIFFKDQIVGKYSGHMAAIPNNPVLYGIACAYGVDLDHKEATLSDFLRGIADALEEQTQMAKINNIDDIDFIVVHWSESTLINDELGCDDNCDIEKDVNPNELDDLVRRASKEVGGGYDKTSLSVKLESGLQWCSESKFYLTSKEDGLLKLLNKG